MCIWPTLHSEDLVLTFVGGGSAPGCLWLFVPGRAGNQLLLLAPTRGAPVSARAARRRAARTPGATVAQVTQNKKSTRNYIYYPSGLEDAAIDAPPGRT